MKAAVVTEQGVQYKDAPKPTPKAHELLIKVKAASLNRADLAVAAGNRHGTVGGPGTIVGLECAGEVEAVGADVRDFKPGDRVMSSAAGSFAEYAVTDAGRAHKIPPNNMSYEQGTEQLYRGDILIAYSDGVTEPENEFGEFGEERLVEVVRRHRHLPLDAISEQVMQSLRTWIGGQEQPDDITMVLARQL